MRVCQRRSTEVSYYVILFAILLLFTSVDRTTAHENNPGNLLQYRSGDILVAGLMRVHRRGGEACSSIQEDGIQAVETMNMIIDQINKNKSILPGIKLGTIMVDTCDVDSHALKRVVLDILPLIWNVSIQSTNTGVERPKVDSSLVAGVVGAASSAVSIQVANLLQVFEMPQVSYWSTSPDLSDKARYKYFFRTVPSDTYQAIAMIAVVKQLGWNYVSVVYEEDFYGVKGFTGVRETAAQNNICIATSQPVPRNPTSEHFRTIVKNLLAKSARAIIVFTKRNDASDLMKAAQEIGGDTEHFIWIGSDGWSRQVPITDTDFLTDETIEGTIGFTPRTNHLEDLDEYLSAITLSQNQEKNNFRNPWFAEYISKKNNCSLNSSSSLRECLSDEKVNKANFLHLTKMESVADAVLSFVYALDKYHKDKCGGKSGLCPAIAKLAGTNKLAKGLYKYLRNLSFLGINGEMVKFDENQDGPAVYNILNYQLSHSTSQKSRLENWVQAGIFNRGNKQAGMSEMRNIDWQQNLSEKVEMADSVCSKPCGIGEATIRSSQICCWHCQVCRSDEYVANTANTSDCVKCDIGTKPNEIKTGCVQLPIQELTYDNKYSIACICVGSFGILCTSIVLIIYIKFHDTAIVKASGRELCFLVLFGVFMTYLNFLSLTARASVVSCIFDRIFIALAPTVMYAGLLTKTVRVVIIFQSKKILSQRVKMFLKPLPQILWTLSLVLVQAIVLSVWFGLRVPEVDIMYPTIHIAFRACKNIVDITLLIGLVYPFILIIICTILATVNRNVPTGFNETQYIGFSMYTTCVIWLAFLPIFITNSSDLAQRIMTISICLSLSATTVLFCLFGPRCYKIIFHPEENTQKSVMSSSADKTSGIVTLSVIAQQNDARARSAASNGNSNNNKTLNGGNPAITKNGKGSKKRVSHKKYGYHNHALAVAVSELEPHFDTKFNECNSTKLETIDDESSASEDVTF